MSSYMFAHSVYETLHQFVSAQKLHPILVNFTAALIPVSVGSDIFARVFGKQALRDTGWWTLCFAAVITPFTAMTGWLFWMNDDNGVSGMTIHKWLGTALAVLLVGLVLWRWWFVRSDSRPNVFYLLVALAVVVALVYQGHLGGDQSFSMSSALAPPARSSLAMMLSENTGPFIGTKSSRAADREGECLGTQRHACPDRQGVAGHRLGRVEGLVAPRKAGAVLRFSSESRRHIRQAHHRSQLRCCVIV